jgi:hypothetical protein
MPANRGHHTPDSDTSTSGKVPSELPYFLRCSAVFTDSGRITRYAEAERATTCQILP